MENWQVAALGMLLNFAGSFGGVVVAIRFIMARIDKIENAATRAHDRMSQHIHDHATGAL
jgi:hypothetical protein